MIIDIFSSFDPATHSSFLSLPIFFWGLNLSLLTLIHPSLWLNPNRLFASFSLPINNIFDQNARSFSSHILGFASLLTSLFIIIILINFSGLLPYVFSSSSHLLITFSFGLPLWLALIISGIYTSPSSVAASLLPRGAPWWLNPFLTIVETSRILVRPITLSFRLAANISAGHILIGLIRTYLVFSLFILGPISTTILFLLQVGYTLFEIGICIIQAYVFCLLLSLYRDDHPSC